MDKDFNDFQNNYSFQNGFDMNDIYKDPMFNPIMQYEQAYSYYKYLCMQMDYKIKCKEYELLCAENKNSTISSNSSRNYNSTNSQNKTM